MSKELSSYFTDRTTVSYLLLDFTASWCGPCKAIAPHVEELAKTYPDVKILKIDIDKYPDLADTYHVSAVPTFLLFRLPDETPIGIVKGASLEKLKKMLKKTDEKK